MIKVGLTGGYATGKSFVARCLQDVGCFVIYADRLGHSVLLPDGSAYTPVVETFGREILDEDGSINRKKLGAIVFRDPALLARLNAIVHPAVFREEEQLLLEFARLDPCGIAVIEAAILIETGRFRVFDRLIVTECSEETQMERAMKRDGASREDVQARLSRQLKAEERRVYADFLVNTDGTKEETVQQVVAIFKKLRALADGCGSAEGVTS